MCSPVKGRDREQGERVKTLAKLQVAKVAFTATFDHAKGHSRNVQVAEPLVQVHMKSNFRKYIQTLFDQANEAPKCIN